MWLLPSRGRPAKLSRFFARAVERGMSTPGHVWIDEDDPCLAEYRALVLPEGWTMGVYPRIGVGPATNAMLKMFWGEPWFGICGDDAMPVTQGWDALLIKAAENDKIAYADDGIRGQDCVGHLVMGGDLARDLGWIILPGLQRIYGDDALHQIGTERNALRYRPDVLIEHWHFSNGKAEVDDTYQKPEAENDRAVYEAWRATRNAKPITICCLNAGNYLGRGSEYVNTLYDMVRRNLREGFPGRFVCFTDDPNDDLHEDIEVRPLPVEGLPGWWNKIALFKKGVFEEGEQVLFLDLDTLIVGSLDEIVAYQGDFALLRDFYYPQHGAPGVIAWKASKHVYSIWDEWDAQGRPMPSDQLGDLWWINSLDQGRFAHRADKLQDLYPDQFVSYKVHCTPYPPKGSSVVCFHGEPRPHNCGTQWVEDVWKIGGLTLQSVSTYCNAPDSELKANIKHSSSLDIPWLSEQKAHDGIAVIIGGGPSLIDSLDEIRCRQVSGQKIFALNNAANALAAADIRVDYQIVMDARPENAGFVARSAAMAFILASQVNRNVFDAVEGRKVTIFHASIPGLRDLLPEDKKNTVLVGGGTTVLTRAMVVAHLMGYRTLHLFGVDSSFRGDEHHAYAQLLNADKPSEVMAGGRKFMSCPWMMAQVGEFQIVATTLADEDSTIHVHGGGLLPYVAKLMTETELAA